jgi:hypothetical protein
VGDESRPDTIRAWLAPRVWLLAGLAGRARVVVVLAGARLGGARLRALGGPAARATHRKEEHMRPVRLDNLKAQRVAAGLSITRLAQKANVSDLLINRLEMTPKAGECSGVEAQRIADALGVSLATLGQALL